MNKRFTFQSGRSYSENGQRIATQEMRDGVVVVDIDRNVDFFIRCQAPWRVFDDAYAIMAAYDNGFYSYWPVGAKQEDYDLRDELRALAETAPKGPRLGREI